MSSRKLSTLLRRTLLSTHRISPEDTSKIQSFISFPSKFRSLATSPHAHISKFDPFPRTFRPPDFSRNLEVYKKAFCSCGKVELRCWNCNAVPGTAPFLFCEACRSIQPVDKSVDYFQLYGLDKKYDIEEADLEGKYKSWQKKLHPDLVHTKSEKERDYAAEQSARVTDAYRTLNKPLSRAIYILTIEGVEVDQEETIYEPELLAEIMELREAVEEAADSKALMQLQSEIQEKLNHWSDAFASAFQNKNYEDAKTCIRRMTYYTRTNEEIVKKL